MKNAKYILRLALTLLLVTALVAAALAWKKCPVMICVLGAIAADFIVYLIIL